VRSVKQLWGEHRSKKDPSAGDLILDPSHMIGSKVHDAVTSLASGRGFDSAARALFIWYEFAPWPRSSWAPSMVDRKIVAIILIEKS
jgi:hypothetical protein